MPDRNGFKLLEHVGLEMSADDSKSVVLKGVTHGAVDYDYLMEPARIEALKNIGQHVVRKKRNVSEHSESAEETGGDRQHHQKEGDDGGDSNSSSGNNEGRKRKEEEEVEEKGGDKEEDTSSLKKPRVVWKVELHQQFLAAVNHLGVDSK